MNTLDNRKFEQMALLCIVAAALWTVSLNAHAKKPSAASVPVEEAERQTSAAKKTAPESIHRVVAGEYLGGIAAQHGVSLVALMEINGIKEADRISEGLELIIPEMKRTVDSKEVKSETAPEKKEPKKSPGIVIRIPKGVTLSRIAKVYGVSVRAIVRANPKLAQPDQIRSGQKILIPGAEKIIELVPPPPCYKTAVEFYRVRTDESRRVSLQFCNGRTNPGAIEVMSEIATSVGIDMPFPLHPRLADMMQDVADAFPGKRIEVISGQRVRKTPGHESYHNKGQAIDFRVAGVSSRNLINVIRKFKNSGVGYYPNSVFVHMDTREKSAYWIDYSAPGEKAIYGRADMTVAEIESIRAARRAEQQAREIAETEADRKDLEAEIEAVLNETEVAAPAAALSPETNDAVDVVPEATSMAPIESGTVPGA